MQKRKLNRKNAGITQKLPVKVIQFGGGNFLRAFADYLIDKMNHYANFNAGVVVVKPTPGKGIEILNGQNGLYNLFMKGVANGEEVERKELISCIQKGINPYDDYDSYLGLAKEEELEFLISNTTEAGIAFDDTDTFEGRPHKSFPAKVAILLYKRFQHFKGDTKKGLAIIPCELINHNADVLKEIILKYAYLWKLEDEFVHWVKNSNDFHNTLVDRIVPGYPKDELKFYEAELEFEDRLIVSSELFLLWVIEGGKKLKAKIPFHKIDENILIVEDLQPYRTRKVRILNGVHTVMVPLSLLFGNETVKETVDHEFTGKFIKETVFEEIIPTLALPKEELYSFAEEVLDRFRNPYIKHQLSSIALNSISKFKVRVLPSILSFQQKFNVLPLRLTFAFACLLRFYKGVWKGKALPVNDDAAVIKEIQKIWELRDYQKIAGSLLAKEQFWGQGLNQIPELKETSALALELINTQGIEQGYTTFSEKLK